jgi:glutamyl-tRNA synthetase
VVLLFQERAKTLQELAESARICFGGAMEPDPQAKAAYLHSAVVGRLRELLLKLEAIPSFTAQALEAFLRNFAVERGIKLVEIAQPLRVALTGKTVSPPIFEVMEILGRSLCLQRLEAVLRDP